ncbi:mechanosensitive ion channel family protein, partial [Leptolyngbya cf. ectocarpi LEGE 11479]|nr:mechanosensitive ion channel family protein [Leptolyngbya cf. ectocarpi LEGE 11479]
NVSFVGADNPDDSEKTQARVTFFILGSNEDSIQLRKRLLELSSEKIAKELDSYNMRFKIQEPTIYVESPVTI